MRYVVLLLVFLFSIFFTTEMQAQNESKSLTEYKIEQLQKELDKLKKDADDTKDNKLEQKKDIENINNRVGDINLYVAFYGTLTTVLLVGFGFISYKNAKTDAENTVEKWVENDGKKMLEAINKNLEKEAENKINSIVKAGEEKITALSNNFEKDHNEQLQKHENDHIELTKKYTPEEKEAVSQEAAKSQRKENKTFMDYWNFIVDFSANGKYDEILSTIMEVEASSIKMSIKQKADFQFAKGYVCSEKEMYDEAIEAYKKAIEINPKKDEAYYNMGNAYNKKGMYDEAIEAYKKAIEINPKRDEAYTNLFELQLILNQEFDDEQKYIDMFEGDKKTLIKYEMLKVLQSISKGGTYSLSLKEWEDKYQGVGLGGWGWAELDRWIGDMDDGDNKTKLLEAIEEFKTHK